MEGEGSNGRTMVRMRYQYPQRTPEPKPQRFPVGTRVANPLEGRTGHIDTFNNETGVYHLVFNDGHQEDVPDANVDRFVIRQQQQPTTTPTRTISDEPTANNTNDAMESENGSAAADPENVLHAVVRRIVRSYDGVESEIVGSVAAYLPNVDRYRIMYENCLLEDMSPLATKQAVARSNRNSKRKTQANDGDEEQKGGENDGEDPELVRVRKKLKVGTTTEQSPPPPLPNQRFPTRSAAYTILRKILLVILAQDDVKRRSTEKQRTILKNDEIKPHRKALEQFVEADGLKLLQQVLVLWMKKVETHSGAMLVLKILAALPGVTAEAVLGSQIGKTLRGIARVSRELDHVDVALGDLADWVVRTWKREVIPKAMTTSGKALASQQSAETKATTAPALYIAPVGAHRKLKAREATTAHLRELLTKPLEPEPVTQQEDQDQEPEFFLANYNSLGSIDKRRPMRQIIHIESLVERVRKKHDEQAKQTQDDGRDEASESRTSDGKRRLRFRRRDEVVEYFLKVAPYKLLETARSKIMDAKRDSAGGEDAEGGGGSGGAPLTDVDAEPENESVTKLPRPNKLMAPVKSILKIRTEEVMAPYSRITWSDT